MTETIWLQRPSGDTPWGFRLAGGRDYQQPLRVQRVTPGSVADTGLSQDDVILRIGETDTNALTYAQAMEIIKEYGNMLQLCIYKRGGGQGSPAQQVAGARPSYPTSGTHGLFENMYRSSDVVSRSSPDQQQGMSAGPAYPPYQTQRSVDPYKPSAPKPFMSQSSYDGYNHAQASPQAHQPTSPGGTRLQQQLSDMEIHGPPSYNKVSSPQPYEGGAPSYPSPGQAPSYPSPGQTQYGGGQQSPYGGQQTPEAPSYVGGQGPQYGSHSPQRQGPTSPQRQGPTSPQRRGQRPGPPEQTEHQVPDAVINAFARNPEKKPFAYAPDMSSIQAQREKVRRRAPNAHMPRYQEALNLPSFDDRPVHKPQTTPQAPEDNASMISNMQYNTPLNMYSEDSAVEAFEGQTGASVPSPGQKKGEPDVTQSATYGMIHGLDKHKPRPKIGLPDEYHERAPRGPTSDDELKFSGVNRQRTIPSRSFQMVQQMTQNTPDDSGVDTASLYPDGHEESGGMDTQPVGDYDQKSIRYTGKNIPSKSFRMLQNMTGGEDPPPPETAPDQHQQQQPKPRRRPPHQPQNLNYYSDDAQDSDSGIEKLSYVGGNIPSRAFKMLQHGLGDDQQKEGKLGTGEYSDDESGFPLDEMCYLGKDVPSKAFHLIQEVYAPDSSDAKVVASERRLRRRRQKSHDADQDTKDEDDETSAFDEQAYLSGLVPIVSGEAKPLPPKEVKEDRAEWQKDNDNTGFDENDYLAGRIGIVSGQPRPRGTGGLSHEPDQEEEVGEEENKEPFDEDAYLSGKVSFLGNEPKEYDRGHEKYEEKPEWVDKTAQMRSIDEDTFSKGKAGEEEDKPDWIKKTEVLKSKPFDESAFGRNSTEPERAESPEHPVKEEDYDEEAFLAGQIGVVSGGTPKSMPISIRSTVKPIGKNVESDLPDWAKKRRAEKKKRRRGQQPGEGAADDTPAIQSEEGAADDTPAVQSEEGAADDTPAVQSEEGAADDTPAVQSGEDDVCVKLRQQQEKEEEERHKQPFDENAFMAGKMNILRGSADRELDPKPIENAPENNAAPWHKEEAVEEKPEEDFDEAAYLRGKIPLLRQSVDRDSSLPPREPRRKQTRQRAPWERDDPDNQDGACSDAEFDENAFLAGRIPVVRNSVERETPPATNGTSQFASIPSRKFNILRRSVSRDRSTDPEFYEEEKEENESDRVIEHMAYTGTKIPSKTFLKLKKSVNRQASRDRSQTPTDPMARIRQAVKGADGKPPVDKAIDNLSIDKHDPEKYMEMLKQTVGEQNGPLKVEAEDEVTDF